MQVVYFVWLIADGWKFLQLSLLLDTIQIYTYLAGRRTSDFMYKVLNYQPSEYKFVRCDDMADADLIIVIGGTGRYSGVEYDNDSHEVNGKWSKRLRHASGSQRQLSPWRQLVGSAPANLDLPSAKGVTPNEGPRERPSAVF
mgnify:CR=1 FL=1